MIVAPEGFCTCDVGFEMNANGACIYDCDLSCSTCSGPKAN